MQVASEIATSSGWRRPVKVNQPDKNLPANSQFRLLQQRRFLPFFLTQFLGALNDNVFRNGLIILVTFQGILVAGMNASVLANVAGAVFILPFLLFSAIAGQLADKFEKAMLFRRIKLLEIGLMTLATMAFIAEAWFLLLLILFLMGTQSTLFGPVKFAYLPQQLRPSELIGGNALVEAGTYSAIIIGLLLGGLAVAIHPGETTVLIVFLLTIAAAGFLAATQIPSTPAADPGLVLRWNLFAETLHIIGHARRDRQVFIAIVALSWFWFYGSVVMLQLPAYTQLILAGNESITTTLLVVFAVGVGAGSLACDRLSGRRIETGLAPLGTLGLSLATIDLYFQRPVANGIDYPTVAAFLGDTANLHLLLDIALIGAFGGIFSVPLYALIQHRAERRHLSRIIAANNVINSIFMVSASLLSIAVLSAGFTIPQLLLLVAMLNLLIAGAIYALQPQFLQRFVLWLQMRVALRVRVHGSAALPADASMLVVYERSGSKSAAIVADALWRSTVNILAPGRRASGWTESLLGWDAERDADLQFTDESRQAIGSALEHGNVLSVTLDDPGLDELLSIAARRRLPVVPARVETRNRWGGHRLLFGQSLPATSLDRKRLAAALKALSVR